MSNEIAVKKEVLPSMAINESEFGFKFEEFLPIKGFEGMYEISSYGKVISIARIFLMQGRKKQTTKSRVLSPKSNGNGYLFVDLWKDGKRYSRYLHRLVLETFAGECPNGYEACHNKPFRWFNHLSNLRWDTKENNHADKFIHGTIANGEKARSAKLTENKVTEIRSLIAKGIGQKQIAEMFSIKQPTVSDIANKRTWKHI